MVTFYYASTGLKLVRNKYTRVIYNIQYTNFIILIFICKINGKPNSTIRFRIRFSYAPICPWSTTSCWLGTLLFKNGTWLAPSAVEAASMKNLKKISGYTNAFLYALGHNLYHRIMGSVPYSDKLWIGGGSYQKMDVFLEGILFSKIV